ncbi:MAG TPA: hypothetical protein DDZ51_18140 [Planctomycetaceae bacterium]|nr:hypothetical protein [Planctomycetaceae bacterium]
MISAHGRRIPVYRAPSTTKLSSNRIGKESFRETSGRSHYQQRMSDQKDSMPKSHSTHQL